MNKIISHQYQIPIILGLLFLIFIFIYCYFFTGIFYSGIGWKQLVSLLILYISIVFLLIVGQKWQQIKNLKADNLESQINQLQLISSLNQLNPHFMFNSLNTISSLIVQKDSQVAYRAMVMLTKLMRYLLENSDKISCSLIEEINFVKNYLEIETIRYNKSFIFNISVNSSVNQELLIPKMIIQLHVENAVKHGLVPKDSGQCFLNISINQTNNMTMIVIKDNGIGRKASKKLQLDRLSTGKGIEISEQLILLYNKLHKSKVSQSFKDIMQENGQPAGTEVLISIQS